MNDCSYFEEQISGLLDGVLSQEETEALFAHLAQCPSCSALYEDLKRLSNAMPHLEGSPPAGFAHGVLKEISRRRKQKARRRRSLAAVLAVVLLGACVFHQLRPCAGGRLFTGATSGERAEVTKQFCIQTKGCARLSCSVREESEAPTKEGFGEESASDAHDAVGGFLSYGGMAADGSALLSAGGFFAVLTIQGAGCATTLSRGETMRLLQKLNAGGASYLYRPGRTDQKEKASRCLVRYTLPWQS
ncbi:MAG: anti-sigma factor family protein [Oscillospiraceae bacterium]|jgi:hypothetical protein